MADAGSIGTSHSGPGRRTDSGWWSAGAGISHSDPGRRTDSGWWSAAQAIARLKVDSIYFVPNFGWGAVPLPKTTAPPFLAQLPGTWWTATAYSITQGRGRNGAASLSGTVSVQGAPAARRVVVVDRKALEIVGSVVSAADGTWAVGRLDPGDSGRYVALCLFDPGTENAAVLDRLTPG